MAPAADRFDIFSPVPSNNEDGGWVQYLKDFVVKYIIASAVLYICYFIMTYRVDNVKK